MNKLTQAVSWYVRTRTEPQGVEWTAQASQPTRAHAATKTNAFANTTLKTVLSEQPDLRNPGLTEFQRSKDPQGQQAQSFSNNMLTSGWQ